MSLKVIKFNSNMDKVSLEYEKTFFQRVFNLPSKVRTFEKGSEGWVEAGQKAGYTDYMLITHFMGKFLKDNQEFSFALAVPKFRMY